MTNFIKNSWYVCASSDEIISGKLFERIIINEPIVFYRKSDGSVTALENRCCHRHYPLSKGTLEGNHVRCGYHGFLYECTGTCIEIPGQEVIPRNAKVQHYPTAERYSWVWIWMGDPELADEKNIPDYHWMSDPEWRGKSDRFDVKSNYRLIVQNLLDLSHLAFVHASTIGTRAVIDAANVKFEREDNEVRISRWMINIAPPATYHKLASFDGNVDRWQIVHFIPPGFVRIYGGACPTGTGAPDGHRVGGLELTNLHAITPETDRTTHYFWSQCHKGMLDRPDITNVLFEDVLVAFKEDHRLFEAQQILIDMDPLRSTVNVMNDAGALHAMRILDRLEGEQAKGGVTPIGVNDLKFGLS
ncbi:MULTISPECIES: aromatic ring-hydroxylating dioxygenase subunit alpha [Paraburkholderia]|uniref:aromatic ring-hydroxylating dioxygenase subunit alpha n=1 Tax=Paraburkholderia TaxID=1822464 RepID=UPI00225AEAD3|nr:MULTISPECIES: aromatic ring-hydroxylating dioxygenase subunit alpha [Paraburkholderia]MCX4162745.1 aromatic ring-hydroxylating dioxygenase subunit alpha [Paraburkholderia megapolitana]MDN7158240.1 aromatic ring-hydroxylating dioxygenase subunit alpha [Paraburkholderia sp. CHISQ3]MDQ6495287.1 aromatic ring-hydroxylating dioxygenase subunit alpha [Paraburkholderia megapolitana]